MSGPRPKSSRQPAARKRSGAELSEEERALLEQHLQDHPPRRKAEAPPARPQRVRSLANLARRGEVPVERALDLHGRTVEAAWRLVDDLLWQAQAHGWLYLRVITGKGVHSEDGRAVLSEEIPARLRNDFRVAEIVQAVRARDGGAGAWFVRVRH